MISSNENLGDRPVRKNIRLILFAALAFLALAVILAALFFKVKKPEVAPASKKNSNLVRPEPFFFAQQNASLSVVRLTT